MQTMMIDYDKALMEKVKKYHTDLTVDCDNEDNLSQWNNETKRAELLRLAVSMRFDNKTPTLIEIVDSIDSSSISDRMAYMIENGQRAEFDKNLFINDCIVLVDFGSTNDGFALAAIIEF